MHALTLTSEEAAVADYYARAILKETVKYKLTVSDLSDTTSPQLFINL